MVTRSRQGSSHIVARQGSFHTSAATMPVTLVMLEAIRDYFFATGIRIGMKPAGGIRNAKAGVALPRHGQGNPRR